MNRGHFDNQIILTSRTSDLFRLTFPHFVDGQEGQRIIFLVPLW